MPTPFWFGEGCSKVQSSKTPLLVQLGCYMRVLCTLTRGVVLCLDICHCAYMCFHLETQTLRGSFGSMQFDTQEALVKKAMTTKYPSSLILLELAEELAAKKCDLNLIWIRRDWNQLADDLTNEKFDSFDPEFRVPVKGDEIEWRVLDKLLNCADSFYGELKKRKAAPIGPVRKAGKIRKLSPW